MNETRDERRARILAEQEKVVPGTGLRVRLDRGLWSLGGGQQAGTWNWMYVFFGLVTFTVLTLIIGTSSTGVIGGLAGLVLVTIRGYWLHLRYLRRA